MRKKVATLDRKKFEIGDTFNPYGLFIGSFMPQWLEVRPELSPGAKMAYTRLCRHAGERGECKPNQNLLAAEIGLKKRQTQTYLQELEVNNLIRPIRRGQGRSNEYEFLIHEWMFENILDARDAAYQSSLDVQDTAHPEVQDAASLEVQDAAHPIHYKKIIKEDNHIEDTPPAIFINSVSRPSHFEELIDKWYGLAGKPTPGTPPPGYDSKRFTTLVMDKINSGRTWEEITTAMENYWKILRSSKHYYDKEVNIGRFVGKTIDDFWDYEQAWSFFWDRKNGPPPKSSKDENNNGVPNLAEMTLKEFGLCN